MLYCGTKGKSKHKLLGCYQDGVSLCRLLLPRFALIYQYLSGSTVRTHEAKRPGFVLNLVSGLFAMHWPTSTKYGFRAFRVQRCSSDSMVMSHDQTP